MKTIAKVIITETDLLAAKEALAANKLKQEKLREAELEIRTYLADELHDGEEGARTIKIGDTKVTITRPLNYNIDSANAERFSQEHGDIALACLSWSPKVKVSGFKANLDIASEYCTVKPGPAQVEFK